MRRILLLTLVLLAATAAGQETTTAPTTTTTAAEPTTTLTTMDAAQTREQLRGMLQRHPTEVARVLQLDPLLLTNESYMANYPELRAFVAQHPEITHNPRYFLGGQWAQEDNRSASMRFWEGAMEGVAAMIVFIVVTITMAWLIKTLIQQRRWNRLSRVQNDVHTKLLDRFASNDQLLSYIQTPAGQRFLEAAPIAVETQPPGVSAPIGRILWSLQVGIVLLSGGIGLQVVSGQIPAEVALPLFVIGVIVLAVGVGFIASAAVSFLISRRLGVVPPSPAVTE